MQMQRFILEEVADMWQEEKERNQVRRSVAFREETVEFLDEFRLEKYKLVLGPHGIHVNCFYGIYKGETVRIKKEHNSLVSNETAHLQVRGIFNAGNRKLKIWNSPVSSKTISKESVEEIYHCLCQFEKERIGYVDKYTGEAK